MRTCNRQYWIWRHLIFICLPFALWLDGPVNTAKADEGMQHCASSALLIRFEPGAVSFSAVIDHEHDYFSLPIEQAEFAYRELRAGLLSAGVETFETVAEHWRHLDEEDFYDRFGESIDLVDFADVYRITFSGALDVESAIESIQDLPGVTYVECDPLMEFYYTPNDPYFADQWHLDNTGQVVQGDTCHTFYDINAPEAWDIWDSAGSRIGIIDGLIDRYHEDLEPYIDVSLSKSFVPGSQWWGVGGHGTKVASLAASGTDDSLGVAGVSNLSPTYGDSIIVALRVGGNGLEPPDTLCARTTRALSYVTSRDVYPEILITNQSMGYPAWKNCYAYSATLRDAFRNAFNKDICLVVAAGQGLGCSGNGCPPADTCFSYPAAFLDYCLAVAAVTCTGDTISALIPFVGSYIDVTAPGGWGMYRADGLTHTSYSGAGEGTSFSAPLVAGSVALLKGAEPDLTNEDSYHLLELTASEMEGSPMSAPIRGGHGLVRADTALVYVTAPWELRHGSVTSYSSIYLGEGWRDWMNVTGVNDEAETWDRVWVHAYRLKSTVDLTSAEYDSVGHVWARGRTSSGWKNLDKYDAKFHANYAEVLDWNPQTEVATLGTYTFKAFTDSTETETFCWFPYRPSTAGDDCDNTGGIFKIDYSYLVYDAAKGFAASLPPIGRAILRFAPGASIAKADVVPFHFTLDAAGSYSLAIFDVSGRVVRTIMKDAEYKEGQHTISWDRKDAEGNAAKVGVYFARLWRTQGGIVVEEATERVVLVR